MPFRSKAQMKWMFANKPKMAKKWADKYGVGKRLPEHVDLLNSPRKKPSRKKG